MHLSFVPDEISKTSIPFPSIYGRVGVGGSNGRVGVRSGLVGSGRGAVVAVGIGVDVDVCVGIGVWVDVVVGVDVCVSVGVGVRVGVDVGVDVGVCVGVGVGVRIGVDVCVGIDVGLLEAVNATAGEGGAEVNVTSIAGEGVLVDEGSVVVD